MPTWIDDCERFLGPREGAVDVVAALRSFRSPDPRGGPPAPLERESAGTFERLEHQALDGDADAAARHICDDVDAHQAAMFGRRVGSVDALLASGDALARVLRVGLRVRLEGMRDQSPRALRVRSLADFYYSLGVALHHRRTAGADAPTVMERARAVAWTDLRGGLRHAHIKGVCRLGPQNIHLLEVDAARVQVSTADLRSESGEGTHDFTAAVAARGARAGTSGGFFLYSEPDIAAPSHRFDPVGLLMDGGKVLSPPTLFRGTLLVGAGRVALKRVGPGDATLVVGTVEIGIGDRWNRAFGAVAPDVASVAIVGHRVVATGRSLPVPLNGLVVGWTAGSRSLPPVGTTVEWRVRDDPDVGRIQAAMAGGPLLPVTHGALDYGGEDFHGTAPPRTFSQDETGDQNLLPRLVVGATSDGRLIFAAVDGRHRTRALGMTLRGAGRLMGALGCSTALNLDGGSSKCMVLLGRSLDLASTEVESGEGAETSVRPVHTAILMS